MKKHNTTRAVVDVRSTYVGLDVHKRTISVAMLRSDAYEPVTWQLANGPQAARRLVRQLRRRSEEPLRACYEAGPCGYNLQRELLELDVDCVVIAPSLIPRKPGDRVKTDRRDARKLAELHRGGLLTEVYAPTLEQEAARGLSRCREDATRDLKSARHRLGKFLDMRGLRWDGGKTHWTKSHLLWLNTLRFERETDQFVFDHYLSKVLVCAEQLASVTRAFEELAQEEPYAKPVGYLRCFHGIDTITALSLVVELFHIVRFRRPRELMAYLGLVPSEDSSGDRQRRGAITKTGNGHVRRLLIEAAHHSRTKVRISGPLRRRRCNQPDRVVALANRAHERLNKRFWHLTHRGKRPNTVVVAVARELVGFVWAALHMAAQQQRSAA
jgi:transposase